MFVAGFAVFGKVEAGAFDFWIRTKTDDDLDDDGDDEGGNDAPDDGEGAGFDLVHEETFFEACHDGVGLLIGEDAGEDGSHGAADAVDAMQAFSRIDIWLTESFGVISRTRFQTTKLSTHDVIAMPKAQPMASVV